ncbi:DedA family protein [Buchnera aphidicola]|uniref:DedA family protein n=1 Tax=Buchnera aphidicola TaxID=9 RepID=UPI0022379E5E|nr:DedA family protein [Buchnera aphidicola]MCW5197637.1 DedA family protein [Buchnera aphidicola (Chaitophorus viminalis)]
MEVISNYISKQSTMFFILITIFISFIESFVLIGCFLPGIVIMSSLGAIIAHTHNKFYPIWIASTIGCLLGDWISYFIGWKFKHLIKNLKIFKNNFIIIQKIKKLLQTYNLITILFGKFIGITRPIIPVLSGMLEISFFKKFFFPNLLGCILWPIIYLMPGIITFLFTQLPHYSKDNCFKKFCIFNIIIIFLSLWIILKNFKNKNYIEIIHFLKKNYMSWLPIIILIIGIINFIILQFHPEMIILRSLIIKIFYYK